MLNYAMTSYNYQTNILFPWVCSITDHRWHKTVIRTSVTHLVVACVPLFLFSPHFEIICDLLLNRCMATWNLSVNSLMLLSQEEEYKANQK